jgi:hypothetical protein
MKQMLGNIITLTKNYGNEHRNKSTYGMCGFKNGEIMAFMVVRWL